MSKKGLGAVLLIGVERGNEITLEYSKKNIINKINSYFGYNFISEIKLKSVNSTKKKMANNLWKLSAKTVRDLLEKSEISPIEAIDSAVERISQVNHIFQIVIQHLLRIYLLHFDLGRIVLLQKPGRY